MIGQALSHFEITAKLGEGGMGEVYRAEDTRLGRAVAIKVLPEAVGKDPERLARFEREARVLASLNHPHIASLHSLESAEGVDGSDGPVTFLVMELVEGDTLARRLALEPLGEAEALPIALQIAEAIEAAHERGIVHRDIKPANVVVDEAGRAKVLDFGIAKALADESTGRSAGDRAEAPTVLSTPPTEMTATGTILGTAAYMSPEQARGRAVDRRTDIWAFGCVLYEMLTGASPFRRDSGADTLAAIVNEEPNWAALPETTAPAIGDLLRRCLDKDPRSRLQAVGEARILLERYLENPESLTPSMLAEPSRTDSPAAWHRALPWIVSGLLAVATGVVWLRPQPEPTLLRATIQPPEGQAFHLESWTAGPAVLSPDGTRLAFSARDSDGRVQLYVRPLDAAQAYGLTGTDDAQYPFWAPDGEWIGFFNGRDGTLKKVPVDGGPAVTLAEAPSGEGGSWNENGDIIFAPGPNSTIHRVADTGGASAPLFPRDERRFNSYRHPRFLPDGRHFLFVAKENRDQLQLMLGALDPGTEPRGLMPTGSQAEVVDGHVFFTLDQVLSVRPFDERALEVTGEAVPLAHDVIEMDHAAASFAVFSVSAAGTLVYQTGATTPDRGLLWRDRGGGEIGWLTEQGSYRTVILSPEGRYALAALEADTGSHDLWLFETARNVGIRFTFEAGDERMAAWTPDGQTVIYSTEEAGRSKLLRRHRSGAGEPELLLEVEGSAWPTSVSPDGRHLVYQTGDINGNGNLDLWVLPLDGSGPPRIFRGTEFNEAYAQFSPDGNWLTYLSSESGRLDSYVEAFPGPGPRTRVSTNSGVYPYWRRDGGEIIYHELTGQVMAASYELTAEGPRLGVPEGLFMMDTPSWGGAFYAPAPDANRFLITPSVQQEPAPLLNLITNWRALLGSE